MKKSQLFLRFVIFLPFGSIFAILIGFFGLYLYLAPSLPSIDELRNIQLQVPLRVYSKDKKLIAEFGEKRRTPVSYNDVQPLFIDAIKAAEDDDFEHHIGIDVKGLTRAAIELIMTGEKRSGGSTITMQVARNFFLTPEKTFKRKFVEIMLALHIEQAMSKQEIMELYINKIFLGKRAYGIEAAANIYYGKSINQLNLAQLAMIAGIPKAPTAYNPINNPQRAIQRRNYVLDRMLELNKIDPFTHNEARTAPISAKIHQVDVEVEAGYVAEWVRAEMIDRFGEDAYTQGYKVITSIDAKQQQAANDSLQSGLLQYDQQHGLRVKWQRLDTRLLIPDQNQDPVPESETRQNESNSNNPEQNTSQPQRPDFGYWLEQLAKVDAIGPLLPAVVVKVEESHFDVLLKTGHFARITDFQWARSFETINKLGPKVQSAQDIVSMGDQVWLKPNVQPSQEDDNLDKALQDDIKEMGRMDRVSWQLAQPPSVQGALIAMNPKTGALQALVGGFDFSTSKFNRATQSDRQPGSSFKPFVYSAALDAGLTPATLINDAPVVFEDANLEDTWRPKNDSGKFYGPTRLRKALYKSRNLVTIRIMQRIGVRAAAQFLSDIGFDSEKINPNLSLALGASAFTPLEMTKGYATLANGGYQVTPYVIEQILDINSEVIFSQPPVELCDECFYANALDANNRSDPGDSSDTDDSEQDEHSPETVAQQASNPLNSTNPQQETRSLQEMAQEQALTDKEQTQEEPMALTIAPRVMDPKVNYLIYTMMQDVIQKGTGRRARVLNRKDLAGKTGTTNDQRDLWFSGFIPELVTVVWVGFDDYQSLGNRSYGSNVPLPIWINFMREVLKDYPATALDQPEGLVSVRIDPESGLKAPPEQDNAIFELFREDHIPSEFAQAQPEPSLITTENGEVAQENEALIPEQLF